MPNFQHLYSPSPDQGGSAPPRGRNQAPPAPGPSREPQQRRPPRLSIPPWWRAKEILPLALGPYYRLTQIDPEETRRTSKYLDQVLEPYTPYKLWNRAVTWYKTETVPAQPGEYAVADEPPEIFFWCQIAGGPFEGIATSPIFSGAPCTFETIRVPTGNYGDTIPIGTKWVIFGEFNGVQSRISQLKAYGFHDPGSSKPWPYTPGTPGYTKSVPVWADPLAHTATQAIPLGYAEVAPAPLDPLPIRRTLSPARKSYFIPPYAVPVKELVIKASAGGGSATVGPGVHNQVPPTPGKGREKKFDMRGAPGSALRKLGDAAGKLSEVGDAAEALSDAIATGYSPRAGLRNVKNPCKGLPLHEKLSCIAMNAENIDWRKAIYNLSTNELQDRGIGKLNKIVNSNLKRLGYHPGRQLGISRYAQLKWKG